MKRDEHLNVMVLSLTILFLGPGITFFSYSLFMPFLVEAYQWGRGITSIGIASYWFFLGTGSFIFSSLLLSFSLRTIMNTGIAFIGLAFFLLSLAHKPLHLAFAYGIAGLGESLAGMIPITILLEKHFPNRTGNALSIATVGMSTGGLIGLPIMERILSWVGWQDTTLVIAFFIWIVGFFVLWLYWSKTVIYQKRTSLPLQHAVKHFAVQVKNMQTLVLRKGFFWMMSIVFIGSFGQIGILSHMVVHLHDLGIDSNKTAILLSLTIFYGILGKFFFGHISDHYSAARSLLISYAAQAAGLCFLMSGNGIIHTYLYVFFFGFGMGSFVPLYANLVMQIYGANQFQNTYATFRIASISGAITGPILAGVIFDYFRSYFFTFLLVTALFLFGIWILKKKLMNGVIKQDMLEKFYNHS